MLLGFSDNNDSVKDLVYKVFCSKHGSNSILKLAAH